MCWTIGEMADVFVRWCIAYRNGEKFNSKIVNEIAKGTDKRFEVVFYKIPKKKIESNSYQRIIEKISKTKRPKRNLRYVGTCLMLPYGRRKERELKEFGQSITMAGVRCGGLCIFDSFCHKGAESAYVMVSYCDESLHNQIAKHSAKSALHYWYVHTNGKEGRHVKYIKEDLAKIFKHEPLRNYWR